MIKGIYLTLLAGPAIAAPVPKAVLDALTGVEVTSGAGEASGFQLTFNLSTRSPLHTLFLASAAEAPLLRVIVVATIGGVPQVLSDGVVTQHQVSPGQDPAIAQLTLSGKDLSAVMDFIPIDGFPFPAMPPEARVLAILAKYALFGIVPIVIPSLNPIFPNPTERIPKQKGTDLQYISKLAEEAGYVFYLEPGPVPGTSRAYWGPEIKIGVPQPALNLDMDAYRNVESLQFTLDTEKSTQPFLVFQEPHTKLTIPVPLPSFNPLQPPLGAIPPLPRRITLLADTGKLSLGETLSRGLGLAARSGDVVQGTGSLDVVRYARFLQPRGLVGVRGAGFAYDGLYFVKSVTTTLKRGECKQRFTLTRNGLVSLTPVVPV
jgi:hypothetical protein